MAQLKEHIPDGVKLAIKRSAKAFSVTTSGVRMLPDYLIIGAQRCGTTSLYRYLVQHPSVAPTVMAKGVHYFDVDYGKGVSWYRGHFPTVMRRAYAHGVHRTRLITGEGSPYYLFHPLVPERVNELLPDVRLIVMLRDPVERAFSHYKHYRQRDLEPLPTFEAALDAEEGRLAGEVDRMHEDPLYRAWDYQHFSYAARGMYAEQLERWAALFPRDRLLVLRSEDFFADPETAYTSVLDFLGLPRRHLARYDRFNPTARSDMRPETRTRLQERFAQPNRRLNDFLGHTFEWDG